VTAAEPDVPPLDETSTTWVEVFAARAAEVPDRPAFVEDGHEVTYAQLHAAAERDAPALAARCRPDGTVAYLGRPSVPFFTLLATAAYAGVPSIGLNWRLVPAELALVVADSDARLLLVQGEFLDLAHRALALAGSTAEVVEATPDGLARWAAGHPGGPAPEPPGPDDVLEIVYTSGTTGRPKGVVLSHRNVLVSARSFARSCRIDDAPRCLVQSPVFHVSGSTYGITPVLSGGTSYMTEATSLSAIGAEVHRRQLTNIVMMPAVLELVSRPDVDFSLFGSLRTIIYGGGPIRPDLLETLMERFDCGFAQSYGLTESVGTITVLKPEDHDPARPHLLHSAGTLQPQHELRIVSVESGEVVPDGVVGEIQVRGPGVMLGYWRNPDATAEAVTPDGWLHTGDLGELVDGYLYVRDRLKDVIVSGGENIYSGEVEVALLMHPLVEQAAVVGVPDARWGEVPAAFVVTSGPVEVAELLAFCREHLAAYKCPRDVVVQEALPRNPNGKVLKAELRARHAAIA
jgi:long-chain acyl-CoA synthetase